MPFTLSRRTGPDGPPGPGLLAVSAALCAACDGPQSTFAPAGPAARTLLDLSWTLFVALGVVYVVVLLVLAAAALRSRRRRRAPTPARERRAVVAVLVGGAVAPAVVGVALGVTALRGMAALSPARAGDELTVDVIGRQWWWEIHYPDVDPDRGVTTANELHVPAGRRVRIRLTSRDVIHSFWVPALHGKMDLIPGRTTEIVVQAERPGSHRGQCAEYCGVQHARMAFWVIVDSPVDFDAWLARERRPAAEPLDERASRGRTVFLTQSCAGCHAVRGTAGGAGGPDLTHVASRRTLAAGTLDNVPGNLAGWIADPQALKPGNLMPRVPLGAADLHALVAYLGTLR
jgi:cytochrome c oxidase subunit 2